MNLNDLIKLLREGEGLHIEFKVCFPKEATKVARVLAAFVNTAGGTILIGINDHGELVGVSDADETMQRLVGVAQQICKPPLHPEMGKIPIGNGKDIVWAKIPQQTDTPRLVEGRFYTRIGPTAIPVKNGKELKDLLRTVDMEWPPTTRPLESFPLITPPKPKSFKGRNKELKRLISYLHSDTISVVVIEGISGIGKTALAAHFASIAQSYEYKVFWLDCRQETTVDSIVLELARFARSTGDDALAHLLEDVKGDLEDRMVRIATALSQLKYAFFFDDYHLIIDPTVDRFLKRIEERENLTKVFITVRVRPRIASIVSFPSVVEEHLQVGLDPISCAQFLHDCRLKVDKKTAHKIWELSGKGHPKALQIFVARTRSVPIAELLSDLPVFQEDLKKEWLMPLLDELPQKQRDILVNLSVFDRPLSLHALRWLYPENEIDSLMVALIDRFIFEYVRKDFLQMHSLIQEFCYSLISDKQAKHVWAAEFYLEQCGMMDNPEILTDVQIESLFAAWGHFIKAGNYSQATEIIAKLRAPLINRGYYDQVMLLLENTIPAIPEDGDWFDITKGRILSLWGSKDEAITLVYPLIESANERIAREAVLVLTAVYNEHDMAKEAITLLESNWHRFFESTSLRIKIRFLSRLVQAHLLMGNSQCALKWASDICKACEAGDEKIGGAIALRQMAVSLQFQKKLDIALSLCKISYELLKEHKRIREAALSQMQIASIHEDLEDYESAMTCFRDALQAFAAMGDRKNSMICRERTSNLRTKNQRTA